MGRLNGGFERIALYQISGDGFRADTARQRTIFMAPQSVTEDPEAERRSRDIIILVLRPNRPGICLCGPENAILTVAGFFQQFAFIESASIYPY